MDSDRSDEQSVEALRRGEETAFRQLIDAHSAPLMRIARGYVGSRAVAEEVVQETWLGVLRGLERFLPVDRDRWPGHWGRRRRPGRRRRRLC